MYVIYMYIDVYMHILTIQLTDSVQRFFCLYDDSIQFDGSSHFSRRGGARWRVRRSCQRALATDSSNATNMD